MIKEEKREIVRRLRSVVFAELKMQPGFFKWFYGPEFDRETRKEFFNSLTRKISKQIPRAQPSAQKKTTNISESASK